MPPRRAARLQTEYSGRSPEKHGVELKVLKVPPEWGGTTDPENLQPLCEECLEGKRQYQETYVSVYYRLVRSAPWPENIHAAIIAEEKRRKANRKKVAAASDGTQ
jgi:hypothetical protein